MDNYLNYLYPPLGLLLLVVLAAQLYVHGGRLIDNVFRDNLVLGQSVHWLLQLGFYCMQLGLIAILTPIASELRGWDALTALTVKLGVQALLTGIGHTLNLSLLLRLRGPQPPPALAPSSAPAALR